MTYFTILPVFLLLAILFDFLHQRAFTHFVDVARLVRVAMLVVLAWTAGGWMLEADAGARAARAAMTCQGKIHEGLMELRMTLREAITMETRHPSPSPTGEQTR